MKVNSEYKTLEDEFGNKLIGDFVPFKVGDRIQETIKFTVMIDSRSPDIYQDDETKKLLQFPDYDYESIPVFRKYKADQLEIILNQAIERKYKISLAKGAQIVFEILMIMLMMVSLVLKSNLVSFVYWIFVLRSVFTNQKTKLLVRINTYMSFFFAAQYFFYVMNLTSKTSPAPFPEGQTSYPRNDPSTDLSIEHAIPWFFHYDTFKDLEIDYLLGIGIDKDQVENLLIDFVNLYCISMYILTFRNPILRKTMKKVFWQFPTKDMDKWSRLTQPV
jgi:hypothetical protein